MTNWGESTVATTIAKIVAVKVDHTFKCSKCVFEAQSERGLKTHITRKHTAISNEVYPKVCHLCESNITSAENMRKHLKSHSFKDARFKCEYCEFVGESKETMELHIGKTHTDTF